MCCNWWNTSSLIWRRGVLFSSEYSQRTTHLKIRRLDIENCRARALNRSSSAQYKSKAPTTTRKKNIISFYSSSGNFRHSSAHISPSLKMGTWHLGHLFVDDPMSTERFLAPFLPPFLSPLLAPFLEPLFAPLVWLLGAPPSASRPSSSASSPVSPLRSGSLSLGFSSPCRPDALDERACIIRILGVRLGLLLFCGRGDVGHGFRLAHHLCRGIKSVIAHRSSREALVRRLEHVVWSVC